jgi:hypothetical protein
MLVIIVPPVQRLLRVNALRVKDKTVVVVVLGGGSGGSSGGGRGGGGGGRCFRTLLFLIINQTRYVA